MCAAVAVTRKSNEGEEVQLQGAVDALTLTSEEQEGLTTKKYDYYLQLIRNRVDGHRNSSCGGGKILPTLFESVLEIIWDVEVLGVEEACIRRIMTQLKNQFDNETAKNDLGIQPSDIQDLLEYKPTEIIADKCCQIILYLCLGEVDNSVEELKNLKRFMSHPVILRNVENEEGFKFMAKTVELFVNLTSGISNMLVIFKDSDQDDENYKIPAFADLSIKSQVTVQVAKCHVARNYRYKVSERIEILKEIIVLDNSNFEWFITRSEMWRRKRRDSNYTRGKRPVNEEFDLVAEAYAMANENPFVRLSLMDCIIDCIRDSRGHFNCGKIKFDTSDETMRFMKDTCRELLKEFPNSIRIHSQISDYFCRFVSFRYFDVQFAEECLQRAYQLNPSNPKSTHRLGIFFRMSKGDISTSFEWFKTTVKLDPLHYNAFMECVKNMIAEMKVYDVIKYMDDKLESPEFASWTELEILEFLFYKGLAYFVKGENEKTLQTWDIVSRGNETIFRLMDLDRTMGFYDWPEDLISTDKLRLWMQEEKDNLDSRKDSAGDETGTKADLARRELVDLLYSLIIGTKNPRRSNQGTGLFKLSPTYVRMLTDNLKASKGSGDE